MKCSRCAHEARLKDRSDGKCPNCKHPFAFEPTNGALFTDAAFDHAIDAVSARGTVRFLPQHVRWQLERQKKRGPGLAVLAVASFGAGLALSAAALLREELLEAAVWFAGGTALMAGLVALRRARRRLAVLSQHSFGAMWRRWVEVNGDPPGLITPRRDAPARTAARDEELMQYSFDRAVICDRPELVDVLLKNRFHFENNCAVLSMNGYPAHAFDLVRRMLRNNAKLLVLAVHDASPGGCGMAFQLAHDPEWFKGQGRVVDVGLRPAHARFFPGQVERVESMVPVTSGQGLSPKEASWLRSYRIDAMAIRPEQLVKRLYRALSEAEKGDAGRGFEIDDDVLYLGVDTDASDGGSDSFG